MGQFDFHNWSLRRGLKVAGAFAAVGFVVPWLLLALYGIADKMGSHLSTKPLLYLCPSSVAALGLDSASLIVGLFGWLVISIRNALLYAIPGTVVGIVLAWWKSN